MSFFKKKIMISIRVSNGLDPDQDQHSVVPDLGPNCLQRLSADNKKAEIAPDKKIHTVGPDKA